MFEADFRLALKEKIDVLSASERVEALLGYKPKEFLLSTISLEGLVHPHDAAVVRQLFSPSSKGESGEVKVRVRHADGRIRCLSWVYERENKAQGFAILNLILRDASRLKHKDADPGAVADLMALMEGMDECAYRKDRNHVITLANRNFRRMLSDPSKGPRDLTGLTDYDPFSEEYADQSYELEEQGPGGSACRVRSATDGARKEGAARPPEVPRLGPARADYWAFHHHCRDNGTRAGGANFAGE